MFRELLDKGYSEEQKISPTFSIFIERGILPEPIINYIKKGVLINPIEKVIEISLEPVRDGSEFIPDSIFCPFCEEVVKPVLSGIYQLSCTACDAGITPDFFSKESLLNWIETEDVDIIGTDLETAEAQAVFKVYQELRGNNE